MIIDFEGKHPKVEPTAFIAENAMGIGDVEIGPGTNIWFHRIVRGDLNYIRIGSNCNIQDACVLHVEKDFYPLFLEDEVVLGHRVVVYGCKIERGALIGIGAIVLNNSEIGEESIRCRVLSHTQYHHTTKNPCPGKPGQTGSFHQ